MRTLIIVLLLAVAAVLCVGCGENEHGLEFMYFDFTDSQTDIWGLLNKSI